MFGPVESLQQALAVGRAGFEALVLESVDAACARDLVVLGERLERLGRCWKLAGTARVTSLGSWEGSGDRSAAEWLARSTGSTSSEARRSVDTAAKLRPATSAALAKGEVSAQQAEAIAGAAAADPAAEQELLGAAKRESVEELRKRCRAVQAQADPDPEATARRIHRQRSYRTWTDQDGVGHLHVSGPSAAIARIDSAVRQRCDRLFREAHREGRREPSEAYAFDALEQLATSGGDGTPVPKGADAKIIVRVDHGALLRGRVLEGEVCEIAGVGPIPVSVVRDWMDDAFVAAILTKGTAITKVVHLGRKFTSEQRTALQWQDPVCARRGCGRRLGLEYDHVEDWAATRTTRSTSAKRWCKACHRLKSAGWRVGPVDADGKHDLLPPPGQSAGDPSRVVDELDQAVASARRARAMASGPG